MQRCVRASRCSEQVKQRLAVDSAALIAFRTQSAFIAIEGALTLPGDFCVATKLRACGSKIRELHSGCKSDECARSQATMRDR